MTAAASLVRPSVAETLEGKQVLVTGVTGFLGKVWLAHTLYHLPGVGRLWVVVRRGKKASVRARLTHIVERSPVFRPLRERHGAQLSAFLRERLVVLEGDVSQPWCGLAPEALDRLEGRLDAVMHVAGLTEFDPEPARAVAINVDGAQHAADVAERCGARLVHISTCFVAGDVASGAGAIPEAVEPGSSPSGVRFDLDAEIDALRGIRRVRTGRERAQALGWPNVYTFSKALAEQRLICRPSRRPAIVRPAIVESALTFPFAGWNEGLTTTAPLLWFISSWFQRLPCKPDNRFDMVPVDSVARVCTLALAAALRGEAEGAVFQVGSSQTNPLRFDRAIELNNLAVRRDLGRADAPAADHLLRRFLDSAPVGAGERHLLSFANLRRATKRLQRLVKDVEPSAFLPRRVEAAYGDRLRRRRDEVAKSLWQTNRRLGRLERMLEMYQPFIHDNAYVFCTERARALSEGLDPDEAAVFGWDVDGIDWRHYWMEVLYPGLHRWSLPELRDEPIEQDPPFEHGPVDLAGLAEADEGPGEAEAAGGSA